MGSKNVSFAFENGLNKGQLRWFDIKTYLGTQNWKIFNLPQIFIILINVQKFKEHHISLFLNELA